MPSEKASAPTSLPRLLHLVCGAGGSRAILGSAGVILACYQAGIEGWSTIGGASGGSIPTALLAGGMDAKTIVRTCIDIDFASLLTRHGNLAQVLLAYCLQDRYEKTCPRQGVLGSERLGQFVDAHVQTWPANYWTVASVKGKQWLFNAQGIFEYMPGSLGVKVRDQPPPLGLAVRASCAIPGIIDAVPFMGQWLFDGALSADGRCPVAVPGKHYQARSADIVACDVGEDNSRQSIWTRLLLKALGQEYLPRKIQSMIDVQELIRIHPAPMKFHSLQFTLSQDQKWEALLSGFLAAVPALGKAGLLTGTKLEAAKRIGYCFTSIKLSATRGGEMSERIEYVLANEGLY